MGFENEKGLDRRELLKRGAIFGAVVSMPFGTTVANAFASAGQAVAPSALPAELERHPGGDLRAAHPCR